MYKQIPMQGLQGKTAEKRVLGWCAGAALVLFAVGLVPILRAGFYAHPIGDDYAFGIHLHDALQARTSPLAALWHTIRGYYNGWQGTYTGVAAMALVPVVFHPGAYFLTPFVMLGGLILATGKLMHTLVRRWAGGERSVWVLLSLVILIPSIQCIPSPAEGFFWWNGSVFYTFLYCVMLLMVDRLLTLPLVKGRRYYWVVLAETAMLAVLTAGANYVTALLSVGFLWLHLLLLLWKDRARWKSGLMLALLALAGFLISALAPGNAVRQAAKEGLSPLAAVGMSILRAGWDVLDFPDSVSVALLLLAIPLLWRLCGKVKLSFRWPVAVVVLAFLIFAAQNAPHYYALANGGPHRLRNIIFFSFFWLALFCQWYLLGWLRRRWKGPSPRLLTRCVGGLCLVTVLAVGYRFPRLTAGKCLDALSDGSLEAYHVSLSQRETMLRDPDISNVVYPPLTAYPKLFYLYPIDSQDPEDFPNLAARNYYHKESVTMAP